MSTENENQDQNSNENQENQEPAVDWQKKAQELEASLKEKENALSEKESKLSEYQQKIQEQEKNDMKGSGNYEDLVKTLQEEINKKDSEIGDLKNYKEEVAKQNILEAKKQALKKHLGAELHNDKHLNDANLDWIKVELDDEGKVKTVDDIGAKKAAEHYRKDFHYTIKSSKESLKQDAAQQPDTSKKKEKKDIRESLKKIL